eukprot:6214564-Pleurochrysis_carterae.AAC.2
MWKSSISMWRGGESPERASKHQSASLQDAVRPCLNRTGVLLMFRWDWDWDDIIEAFSLNVQVWSRVLVLDVSRPSFTVHIE